MKGDEKLDAGGRLVVQDEGGPEVVIAMYRGGRAMQISVSRQALTHYAARFLAAGIREVEGAAD